MLPLVHHPLYDAQSVPDSHRFPMRKYSLVAKMVHEEGYVAPGGLFEPILAPEHWLNLAHDAGYVDAVLHGKLTRAQERAIGFSWSPHVAARARTSSSGTLLAARLALEHGAAANLAGGSHHARFEGGAGFSVFNDVAVAASVLLNEGAVSQILVIDCDVHQGDGTAQIFADEPRVFTASIHCEENWPFDKARSNLDVGLPAGTGDDAYLETLEATLQQAFARCTPQLVFYNAGVDPHEDDRLGKLCLTDAGLMQRDLLVAKTCAQGGTPVCGVLGGGYSTEPALVARRHLFLIEALRMIV